MKVTKNLIKLDLFYTVPKRKASGTCFESKAITLEN